MCPEGKYIIQTYNYMNELFQRTGYTQAQPLQRVERPHASQRTKYASRHFFYWFVFIYAKTKCNHSKDLGCMFATEINISHAVKTHLTTKLLTSESSYLYPTGN